MNHLTYESPDKNSLSKVPRAEMTLFTSILQKHVQQYRHGSTYQQSISWISSCCRTVRIKNYLKFKRSVGNNVTSAVVLNGLFTLDNFHLIHQLNVPEPRVDANPKNTS